jgi:hypothetical protein
MVLPKESVNKSKKKEQNFWQNFGKKSLKTKKDSTKSLLSP